MWGDEVGQMMGPGDLQGQLSILPPQQVPGVLFLNVLPHRRVLREAGLGSVRGRAASFSDPPFLAQPLRLACKIPTLAIAGWSA